MHTYVRTCTYIQAYDLFSLAYEMVNALWARVHYMDLSFINCPLGQGKYIMYITICVIPADSAETGK